MASSLLMILKWTGCPNLVQPIALTVVAISQNPGWGCLRQTAKVVLAVATVFAVTPIFVVLIAWSVFQKSVVWKTLKPVALN